MQKLQFICASMSINGSLSFNQFLEILHTMEIYVSKSECAWLFKHLDDDTSGKVSFDEIKKLIKMMTRIQ